MNDIIKHNDYKRIFHECNLTPEQWNRYQNINEQRSKRIINESQVNIYSCLCRSPYCEKCATNSPTFKKISQYLQTMNYKKVRHVILTFNRNISAIETFDLTRKKRLIPNLMYDLSLRFNKWLWVLEFHSDGYPHYHVFIETKEGHNGIIGHDNIQSLWQYGHVHETYINSESHWLAMLGYARSKGYFANEAKKHQITLPTYLLNSNRVRKFGTNIKERKTTKEVAKEENKEVEENKEKTKKRRTQRSYTEMFNTCDTQSIICVNEKAFIKVNKRGKLLRDAAKEIFHDEIDYKTYRGTIEQTTDFLDTINDK